MFNTQHRLCLSILHSSWTHCHLQLDITSKEVCGSISLLPHSDPPPFANRRQHDTVTKKGCGDCMIVDLKIPAKCSLHWLRASERIYIIIIQKSACLRDRVSNATHVIGRHSQRATSARVPKCVTWQAGKRPVNCLELEPVDSNVDKCCINNRCGVLTLYGNGS